MTAPDLITEALDYCRTRVADMRLWGVVLPELAAALKSHEAEVARLRRRVAELERERDEARAEAAVLRDERRGRATP